MLDAVTLQKFILTGSAIFLSVSIFLCLMRAVLGPGFTDRIIAANMFGTIITVLLAVLAVIMGEGYLLDICLVCASVCFMISVVMGGSND